LRGALCSRGPAAYARAGVNLDSLGIDAALPLKFSDHCVLSQGASHRNAGLQPLLHTHVVREDEALERQSESSARSTAVLQQEHESCALA